MIRYIWNREGRHIYKDESLNEKIPINISARSARNVRNVRNEKIYVNILERKEYNGIILYKVKLYFSNGEVLEGWTANYIVDIEIEDTKDELFDGRFNQ